MLYNTSNDSSGNSDSSDSCESSDSNDSTDQKKKSPNKIILKQIYILQTKLSIKYISKDNFSIFADLQISKIPIGLTKISGEAL